MAVLPTKQPTDRRDPMPTRGEPGDPVPQGMVHDNNRGYHDPKQTKDKIFQEIYERYNNGQAPTHYPPYDPLNVTGKVGPFSY